MTVILRCPNLCCPAVLRTDEADRGLVVECAMCATRFVVPKRPAGHIADAPTPIAVPLACEAHRIGPIDGAHLLAVSPDSAGVVQSARVI